MCGWPPLQFNKFEDIKETHENSVYNKEWTNQNELEWGVTFGVNVPVTASSHKMFTEMFYHAYFYKLGKWWRSYEVNGHDKFAQSQKNNRKIWLERVSQVQTNHFPVSSDKCFRRGMRRMRALFLELLHRILMMMCQGNSSNFRVFCHATTMNVGTWYTHFSHIFLCLIFFKQKLDRQ